MVAQIEHDFSVRDGIYTLGFLLGLYNCIRAIYKDRNDPIRQDLLRCIDELSEVTNSLSEEIQRFLEKVSEARSYNELLRHEGACRRKLELVRDRLPAALGSELLVAQTDWWRVHTEEPWGNGTKRKATQAEVLRRSEANSALADAIDAVRRKILCGVVKAKVVKA